LRALTPANLVKEAAFIEARPTVQSIPANGGWANGDAVFTGANPTDEAVITYYQQKRHIFGDLKIEILDESGKLLSTVPSSKRRGLNRATWSMRLKAPRVPTAASAAFSASTGPRVLPGNYTVKMTKDKNVYTTQLQVMPDPRSKHTPADRRAQFDLSMKLYNLLGDMTFAVDRINGVRLALDQAAAKLPANDPLVARLRAASAQVDELRRKIVATKEGGAITGEERLRENLADLYGNVISYEGRPAQTQLERTDAIARELADIVRDFDAWLAKEMPGLNSALSGKQLPPIKVITREEWDKD
jgi:hypothetical protein